MSDLPYPFYAEYKEINPLELRIKKAVDFYKALANVNFSEFIKAFQNGENEIIVYCTEPEISQEPINPILPKEKLFVLFTQEDKNIPSVFSCRDDFPSVTHLNLLPKGFPKNLCLYEEQYSQLKLKWRSIVFIERIREWLSLTANNQLHQIDQPIEPLFLEYAGNLILPNNYSFTKELFLVQTSSYNNKITLVGSHNQSDSNHNGFKVFSCKTNIIKSQMVNYSPRNLLELNDLFKNFGLDIVRDVIKPQILAIVSEKKNLESNVIVLINIPRNRGFNSNIERVDRIGFILKNTIRETFLTLNMGEEYDGYLTQLINTDLLDENISKIIVYPLSIYSNFGVPEARTHNGLDIKEFPDSIALIGCGALGSQIFMNLRRMGFVNWSLIDDDVLMPHNLARHELFSDSVGYSKSSSLSLYGNNLLNSDDVNYIQDNYLNPQHIEKLYELLDKELVLDISASQSLTRKLSDDIRIKSRRISIFLNPSGTNLVVLAESSNRGITLNQLEASYFKFLYNNELMDSHFDSGKGTNRYGYSCRDVSMTLERDNISVLSGIASRSIRKIIKSECAFIGVWSIDDEDNILSHKAPIEKYIIKEINGWKYHILENLCAQLYKERSIKLPNETGGILLGMMDFERNIVYITSNIESPSDSVEFPNSYVRGKKGLEEKLKELDKKSYGGLVYLGEWHSHPDKCSLVPSKDDLILFNWIKENMRNIGFPPLMMIVGNESFEIYNEI